MSPDTIFLSDNPVTSGVSYSREGWLTWQQRRSRWLQAQRLSCESVLSTVHFIVFCCPLLMPTSWLSLWSFKHKLGWGHCVGCMCVCMRTHVHLQTWPGSCLLRDLNMRDADMGTRSGGASLVIRLERRLSAKVRNGQHLLLRPFLLLRGPRLGEKVEGRRKVTVPTILTREGEGFPDFVPS